MPVVRQITGVLGSVLTLNLRCKGGEARTGLSKLCSSVNVHTHLWVPFNPSSLLANACFVRLGIDHFQQGPRRCRYQWRRSSRVSLGSSSGSFTSTASRPPPAERAPGPAGLKSFFLLPVLFGVVFLAACLLPLPRGDGRLPPYGRAAPDVWPPYRRSYPS
jgi:hypothetical protein